MRLNTKTENGVIDKFVFSMNKYEVKALLSLALLADGDTVVTGNKFVSRFIESVKPFMTKKDGSPRHFPVTVENGRVKFGDFKAVAKAKEEILENARLIDELREENQEIVEELQDRYLGKPKA